MKTIRIGCVSWTYPDWLGTFYPKGTRSSDFLPLYSRVFDIVEVDSSFYHLPTSATVAQWDEKTPEGFLFSVKMPKRISHDSRLKDTASLKNFENTINGLGPKLGCLIAQMPPFFKFEKGFDTLEEFLSKVDPTIRYALEFRDASWFREETYNLLRSRNVSLAWSVAESTRGEASNEVTTDFLYLRFMGKFGEFQRLNKVQKDKSDVLREWIGKLNEASDSVKQAYVMMSNHFEGFAPSTANNFRRLLGLEEINWQERMS